MASFHKTIIVGNLGKDPETRYTAGGDPVCNFSVAVTESWKSKDGEKKENTTWYRVNAFGKLAEICGQWLKKGASVLIEGKMNCREWDKDGVKQYSWELKADSMQMLGGKSDSQRPADSQDGGYEPAPSRPGGGHPANKPKPSFSDLDDSIPF